MLLPVGIPLGFQFANEGHHSFFANDQISYCSPKVRDFLKRDFYFCSSNLMRLERQEHLGGQDIFNALMIQSLDWHKRTLGWISRKPQKIDLEIPYQVAEVDISNNSVGNVIALLRLSDLVFSQLWRAEAAESIDNSQRRAVVIKSERAIAAIHQMCCVLNGGGSLTKEMIR